MPTEENLNKPPLRERRDFDLKRFLMRYVRYWWLFALCLGLALVAARYYNWYTNPTYGITAKLLVKDENSGKEQLLQQLDVNAPDKIIENEIEILRSHDLVTKTLSALNFEVSYFLIGDVKVSEVYTDCPFEITVQEIEFSAYFEPLEVALIDSTRYKLQYLADGEERVLEAAFGEEVQLDKLRITALKRHNFPAGSLQDPAFDKRRYRIRFNTLASLQYSYLSRLSVALAREQSTILQLYLEDQVPQKGLDFLNMHIAVYLQNGIELKNKAAANTAAFLDKQLEEITNDLEQIETNREQYKVSKGIVDLESESQLVLEALKELDAQKALNSTRLNMIGQLEQYVTENQDLRNLAPAALDIDDPLLVKLIDKLSELQAQREAIITSSTVNDPALLPINAEIALTRNSLRENIRNIDRSLQKKGLELDEKIRSFRNRIERIPTTERELLEIERRFRIQESLYTFLLEKRAELAISLAATESDTRIVDAARVLPGPVSPIPQRAYSIAVLLGLLIPVLFIVLAERLNDKIADLSLLQQLTQMPLLGPVRFIKGASGPVVLENPRSAVAEEYRSLRTNLSFFQAEKKSPITLVTSSIGTEGKTFTAINLAAVVAASGQKVILLGLDMRKPRIVEEFKLSNDKGCSTYLSGNASLDEVLQKSPLVDGLTVLPSGPIPPNPSELIMSERMHTLLAELRRRFDKIIIDTPPVGLVSDALLLAPEADSIIFVVRDGVTRKGHLHFVNELYAQGKLPNAAIVFNAVRSVHSYGYRQGYGYGYGYVYGKEYGRYFDSEERRG